jgi:hypothetical protein
MKRILASVSLVLSLALLGGCSANIYSPDQPGVVTSSPGGGEGKPDNGGSGDGSSVDRSVIKTADIYLTSEEPNRAGDQMASIVKVAGGYLDQRSSSNETTGAVTRVSLVVRVPASKLDSVLAQFKDLGAVQNLTLSTSDVTLSVLDLEARISALEVSVNRLLGLLKLANTASDLIEVENALSQRQAELESLKTQLSYYRDAVAMSTINVTVTTPALARQKFPTDFWSGVLLGWQGLVGFLTFVLVAFGVVIPWVFAIGVPAAALTLGVIWAVRRRPSRK